MDKTNYLPYKVQSDDSVLEQIRIEKEKQLDLLDEEQDDELDQWITQQIQSRKSKEQEKEEKCPW